MNAGRLLLTGLAVAALCGCHRKPRFVPVEADSTAKAVDSTAVSVREAQESWEAGPSEEAATLSARVLAGRLRLHPPAEWKDEAEVLLDSLGIGAESASDDCALAVNFFARSDPTSGSWPFLFWCAERGPRFQKIEGRDLHLMAVATRPPTAPSAERDARGKSERGARAASESGMGGVAILFGRRSIGGRQPLLMVWKPSRDGERWVLDQTLGPDSLGGVGTGEFEKPGAAIELVTRTYRTPRHFEECATCPHVFHVHRFRWGNTDFEGVEDREVPTPYSTFVRFIEALMAWDIDAAASRVTDYSWVEAAQRLEWGRQRGVWRIAPAIDESPSRLEFFRGQNEAYRVRFVPRGDDWLIAGFEAVPRTVE